MLRWIVCILMTTAGAAGCQRYPEPVAVAAKPVVAVDLPGQVALSPYVGEGMPIVVNAALGERSILMAVDTSATTSTFDVSLASQIGPGPWVLTLNGATLPAIHDARFKGLGFLRSVVDQPVVGILGMDVLRHYVVQLDFAGGAMRFLPAGSSDADWGDGHDLQYLRGVPCVRGTLAGADAGWNWTIIDTGFSGSVSFGAPLYDRLVGRATPIGMMNTLQFTGENITVVAQNEARFNELRWGHQVYYGLIVARNEYASNMWGLGFLSRHRVTLDFQRDRIYLKRLSLFDRPRARDATGIALMRDGEGHVRVYSVGSGSPASMAGVRPGDLVDWIDALSARQTNLWVLRRRLRAAVGGVVHLALMRDGVERRVKIVLPGGLE